MGWSQSVRQVAGSHSVQGGLRESAAPQSAQCSPAQAAALAATPGSSQQQSKAAPWPDLAWPGLAWASTPWLCRPGSVGCLAVASHSQSKVSRCCCALLAGNIKSEKYCVGAVMKAERGQRCSEWRRAGRTAGQAAVALSGIPSQCRPKFVVSQKIADVEQRSARQRTESAK